MELLLKPEMLLHGESVYVASYPAHPSRPTPVLPSLHHAPSALHNATVYTEEPPTCRKPIVREPLHSLPSYTCELHSLNGGRYHAHPAPPSHPGTGMTAKEWMDRRDRSVTSPSADPVRALQKTFARPLLRVGRN